VSAALLPKTIRRTHGKLAIEAVIFDLDGTLVDSEASYRQAFHEAAEVFGQRINDAEYAGLIGLATPDRLTMLTRNFGPDFCVDSFVAEYYRRKRLCQRSIGLKPGALELLLWLRSCGIPTAVATASSAPTARVLLEATGLKESFVAVMTRDDVEHRKPHPELFLRTASAMGVRPGVCLVVEDSGPGIEAGHAAGMVPVLVPDLACVPLRTRLKSFAVLPDLHQVHCMLAGL
jgi:HAD superfamily hydrolase (TIGR01509 family)